MGSDTKDQQVNPRSFVLREEIVRSWMRTRRLQPGSPGWIDVETEPRNPEDPRYLTLESPAVQACLEAVRAGGDPNSRSGRFDDPEELRRRLARDWWPGDRGISRG